MLIENSNKLCGIPHAIATRLVSISTTSLIDQDRGRRNSRSKSRHRRSSSFNRMLTPDDLQWRRANLRPMRFFFNFFSVCLGVFEGLRKIVGVKSDFSASVEHLSDCRSESAADLAIPSSPVIRSTFKRKVDLEINTGFSIKKKLVYRFTRKDRR